MVGSAPGGAGRRNLFTTYQRPVVYHKALYLYGIAGVCGARHDCGIPGYHRPVAYRETSTTMADHLMIP